jgi:hypothetical protein
MLFLVVIMVIVMDHYQSPIGRIIEISIVCVLLVIDLELDQ